MLPNSNAVLVHTSCEHESTRFDRFGDEVCVSCHHTVQANATQPREGLYEDR